MKKNFLFVSVFTVLLLLVSCVNNGIKVEQKREVKTMLNMLQDVVLIMEDAAKDKVIDEGEAIAINAALKKMAEFSDAIDDKYEDDEEAFAGFFDIKEEKTQEVIKAYILAVYKVLDCEGSNLVELD